MQTYNPHMFGLSLSFLRSNERYIRFYTNFQLRIIKLIYSFFVIHARVTLRLSTKLSKKNLCFVAFAATATCALQASTMNYELH